ncbi:Plant peroxidase [Macleaya cordata]|uniref:Peroxidase n=1 Tax=Macleaya cordata TaxID=56857 RepID=A0A200PXG5_MACCD|nr:Plant peroxidase [Macleaya cordata]
MGFIVLLGTLLLMINSVFLVNSSSSSSSGLSVNFYKRTCPNVEEKIWEVLVKKMKEHPTPNITIPGTLRLFFHDCFVEGCDGSVLITSTAENKTERDADINLSLAGDAFDIVVRAKKVLEESCPGVVSCSDILAILARDVVVWVQGPYWEVEKGRRDGLISIAENAQALMPPSDSNLTDLVRRFESQGLSTVDLITLSGAHTIGFTHCSEFALRINKSDPTLDPKLRKKVLGSCPFPKIDPEVAEALDQSSPMIFDNQFFKNIRQHKVLLTSDQVLVSGDASRRLVYRYAENQEVFFKEFVTAMIKLGRLGVKTGNKGEIRRDCTKFN